MAESSSSSSSSKATAKPAGTKEKIAQWEGLGTTHSFLFKSDGDFVDGNNINLSNKQDAITAGTNLSFSGTTLNAANQVPNITASRVAVSDTNGDLTASSITTTELDFLDGVSSGIQSQLNAKQATISVGSGLTLSSDTINLDFAPPQNNDATKPPSSAQVRSSIVGLDNIVLRRTATSNLDMNTNNITNANKLHTNNEFQIGSMGTIDVFPIRITTNGIAFITQANNSNQGHEVLILQKSVDGGSANILIAFVIGTLGVGTIKSNGSTTSYNTSSDYRIKENVVDMTNSIDRVNQLRPRQFNFISDANKEINEGFLAHEVAIVCPTAVSGYKDAMKIDNETGEEVMDIQQLDQSKLVPLLVGAIQELSAEVDTLKERIAVLEG